MSEQANVSTVQMIYDAFGRGDVSAIVNTLADKFEWHHRGAPSVPWGKSRSTKEEVRSFFRELDEAVQVLGFEVQDYIAQDDKVVGLGNVQGPLEKDRKGIRLSLGDGLDIQGRQGRRLPDIRGHREHRFRLSSGRRSRTLKGLGGCMVGSIGLPQLLFIFLAVLIIRAAFRPRGPSD